MSRAIYINYKDKKGEWVLMDDKTTNSEWYSKARIYSKRKDVINAKPYFIETEDNQ